MKCVDPRKRCTRDGKIGSGSFAASQPAEIASPPLFPLGRAHDVLVRNGFVITLFLTLKI